MDQTEQKKQAYRRGVFVFFLLVAFTAGEYVIARISPLWWAPLMILVIAKAFFILRDYMHVARVFAGDEEEVSR